MEEAPANGKESSHSAHANGMNEWIVFQKHNGMSSTKKNTDFVNSNALSQYLWVWSAHSRWGLQAVRRHPTAAARPCVAWAMLQDRSHRSGPWAVWQERSWAVKRRWMLLHHGRRRRWHHRWLRGGRMVNGWWGRRS